MKKILSLVLVSVMAVAGSTASAQLTETVTTPKIQVQNPFIWADTPDPDIIRVGEYYYLVTTTMHLFPGAPIMRSTDLVHWETVSYLFDEIKDTPRYDLNEGTVYGRGQWATTLRYHKGTFWALFVANDDPHKSMVFKTDDPAKGWKLHSRLPAYHDSSLFFDDDDRVYVFSGSGNISLVELEPDLTAEKKGGIKKTLQLNGKPDGLHEGSRVIKHDGMYYLLCISWPRTGRQEICYRSKNIEGPYDSKVILKSEFGGFGYAGQGTIVDGKHGEWYGVMFQDRGGCGRILTLEPCSWIDGWPVLGTNGDGKIPETVTLDGNCECHKTPALAVIEKDYQWNHNPDYKYIKTVPALEIKSTAEYKGLNKQTAKSYTLTTNRPSESIYTALNTLTWRMWGPTCADTVSIDARKMLDGDKAGFCAFNGDSGILTITREGNKYYLILTEESCELDNHQKSVTGVKVKEIARVEIPKSKLKNIQLCITGDFNPHRDLATFHYSLDGKRWNAIGGEDYKYKMIFDYRRLFMGTRYAIFNYCTKTAGGSVTFNVKN